MGYEPPGAVWGKYPMPTFTNWVTFKEEPYRSNFREKARKLFDEVQKSCEDYNRAVSEAKDPVITILNPKVDAAFREWANSNDHKHWSEETKGGTVWSALQYHEWNAYISRYLQRPTPSDPEVKSHVWAFNLLGWVLVDDIEKACDLMQQTYQNDFQTHVTPDSAWFKSILESVWTELQDLCLLHETSIQIASHPPFYACWLFCERMSHVTITPFSCDKTPYPSNRSSNILLFVT